MSTAAPTNFVKLAPVSIVKSDGTRKAYGSYADTGAELATALWAARAAAVAGDTIYVGPGTYLRSSGTPNLIKDGVNYHFEQGAIVNVTTTTQGSVWDDSEFGDVDAAVECSITGKGVFKRSGCPSATDTYNVMLLDQPDSVVHFECESLDDENSASVDPTYAIGNSGIRHSDGTLYVKADRITSINGVAYWWDSGPSYITADVIQGHSAIYITPTAGSGYVVNDTWTSGDAYVRVHELIGTGANTGAGQSAPCVIAGTTDARFWLTCHTVKPPDYTGGGQSPCFHQTGVRAYVSFQKLYNSHSNADSEAAYHMESGELWLQGMKITASRSAIRVDGGLSFIDVQEMEDPNNRAFSMVQVNGGEHFLCGDRIKGGARVVSGLNNDGAYGILQSAGTLHTDVQLIQATSERQAISVASGATLNFVKGRVVANASVASIANAGTVNVTGAISYNNAPTGTALNYTGRTGDARTLRDTTPGTIGLSILDDSTAADARSTIGLAARSVVLTVGGTADNMVTGDGQAGFVVPLVLNGATITGVVARVTTAGTTGTATIAMRRTRSGSTVDVLSTNASLASTAISSTGAVVNSSNASVATDDIWLVDVDAIHTTPAKGLQVTINYTL